MEIPSLTLLGVLEWVRAYPTSAPRMILVLARSRSGTTVNSSRTRVVVLE